MTRYALTYQLSNDMLRRAMMSWAKPQRTTAQKWKRFAMGFALYLVLVAATVTLLQLEVLGDQALLGAAVGAGITFFVWLIAYRLSTRKLTAMAFDALERHGPVDIVLCGAYIEISSKLSTSRMDWRCIDNVDRLSDATVLRAGGVVYAVPDAALPSGVQAAAFFEDLTAWKEAAR